MSAQAAAHGAPHPPSLQCALAHAERELARDRSAGDREALQAALAQTEKAMNGCRQP